MTNVSPSSFTKHSSPLLLIDPDKAAVEGANDQFKRRFNADMDYLEEASWRDIFPAGTVEHLKDFCNNNDMPLMTIGETRLSVSDSDGHGYYVRLNAFWWEGNQARILLQIELLENQIEGENSQKDYRKEKLRFLIIFFIIFRIPSISRIVNPVFC